MPVYKHYLPSIGSAPTRYFYVADTEAELPSSGLEIGSLGFALDTKDIYAAVSATTWESQININTLITTVQLQAGAVTADKISVSQLSAIAANMGTLTAGTVTLSDANSYIRFGTTPPTSATVGTGLWIDRTGLYGLASNTQIFALTSSGLTLKSSSGTKNVTISSADNELTFSESGTVNVRIGSAIGEGATPGIELKSAVFYTLSGAGAIGAVIDENEVITPSLRLRPLGGGVGAIFAHTTTTSNKTHTFPDVTGTVITTGNLSSITTVGTVTSGTWNGSSISTTYTDAKVTSAFGRTGAVVATTNDYTWAQINKATSSIADITTRDAGDLSSGTLPTGRISGLYTGITGVGALAAGSLATGFTAIGDAFISSASTWNTASSERRQWDGGATNLVAATGRTSLGLGTMATQNTGASGTLWVASELAGTATVQVTVSNGIITAIA